MITVKKFFGDYCNPCKALAPTFNEMKQQYAGRVLFESINVDENAAAVQKYGVRSVPTVIIEKDGREVQRFVGLSSKLAYTNAINESLK